MWRHFPPLGVIPTDVVDNGHGAGQSGCIGLPQAIVNGALDALAPFGSHHLEMPLTPDRVRAALQAAGAVRPAAPAATTPASGAQP